MGGLPLGKGPDGRLSTPCQWCIHAMRLHEKTAAISRPGNDDSIRRRNTRAGILTRHAELVSKREELPDHL